MEIEKAREKAIEILTEFEEVLERYNLTIPSNDRIEGEEGEARIFGSLYYALEDKIAEIIKLQEK